jgi:hypothetical protein
MAEKGWFHPSIGYWQTTGRVPLETIAAYPEGTIEVPEKPGDRFVFDPDRTSWSEQSIEPHVRLQLAKAECRQRIYAVASIEAQINIASAVAVVVGKAASARSSADKALLSDVSRLNSWVAAMRKAVATIAADEAGDPKSDEVWPECPQSVRALVAIF